MTVLGKFAAVFGKYAAVSGISPKSSEQVREKENIMKKLFRNIQTGVDRFMYGRNGQDEFGIAVYLVGFILYFAGLIVKNSYCTALAFPFFCYGLFRAFSKNTVKRSRENLAFCSLLHRPKRRLNMMKLQWKNRRTHKYYLCRCGQIIRVPKGKHKIEIRCPKCGRRFVRRT